MTQSIYALPSPDVAEVLSSSGTVVLPFGSIEQHGPHLPCGTDTMTAELLAEELADRLDALYVPFCPYGITPIHAGYPGTISLRRETFEALLYDVCDELTAMGASTFLLVNWHELNTPSLNAVATDLQATHEARWYVVQACYVAQRIYKEEGGTLSHGGGIETLAVMANDASLLHLERAEARGLDEGAEAVDEMRRGHEVYGFVTNMSEIAEQGWYGDPAWATDELAGGFAKRVVDEIVDGLAAIGAVRHSRGE